MRHLLRTIVDVFMFGSTESSELPPLDHERKFMVKQYRLGLITENEWRDLVDRDPTLAAHFKFRDPRAIRPNLSRLDVQ